MTSDHSFAHLIYASTGIVFCCCCFSAYARTHFFYLFVSTLCFCTHACAFVLLKVSSSPRTAASASFPAASSNMTSRRQHSPESSNSNIGNIGNTNGTTSNGRPGARRCGFPECAKTAKPGGLCISHGGGKKCSVEGCTTSVVSRGCCVAHGGGKRCQSDGCTKSAQTGGFCWIHGGGKKCGYQGCVKRAQSGGACISHGGGKRCRMADCNKVVQYDGLCVGHGGYRKCLSMNCAKKALANSYCQSHGGNSQCTFEHCIRKAVKGGFCGEHKGAAVTPVQNAAASTSTSSTGSSERNSIEPAKAKQQQNAYLQHHRQYHHHHRAASSSHRSAESSPMSVLPTPWQVQPSVETAVPTSYAFAKDRPSLLMDAPASDAGSSGQRSPLVEGRASTTPLPAIKNHTPLPTIGEIQMRPSLLGLGKRTSPSQADSPQPIKRLASLASLAQLSRPSSPMMVLKPLTPQQHTPQPHAHVRAYDSPGSLNAAPNRLFPSTRHGQVDVCQRFVKTTTLCRPHHQHHAPHQSRIEMKDEVVVKLNC